MKKQVFRMTLSVLLCALLLVSAVFAADMPGQAPYMQLFCGWGEFDCLTVDWMCPGTDTRQTYWAVHDWPTGYAGFQNVDGRHVILMSLWDLDDGTEAEIEYVLNGPSAHTSHEGNGIQMFTNYDWKVNTWYSMRIQCWKENGNTYIGQWIREEDGPWLKTTVASYPTTEYHIAYSGNFLEDFEFNSLLRTGCYKNFYARDINTQEWVSLNELELKNNYWTAETPAELVWETKNVTFNCDWGFSEDGSYFWMSAGGGDFTPNGKTLPVTLTIEQPDLPADPRWLLTKPYTDVSDGTYYYDPVCWAVEKSITTGTSATTFSPNDACTRGQIMTFLWRAAGQPQPKSSDSGFLDVDPTMYYGTACAWAKEQGIVSGDTFEPNAPCTRAMAVEFMWRHAGGNQIKGSTAFVDVPADTDLEQSVLWAVENNVTNGTSETEFSPENVCTRGQIVTFLWRYLGK